MKLSYQQLQKTLMKTLGMIYLLIPKYACKRASDNFSTN